MSRAAAILSEITADLSAGSDLQALLQRFLEPLVQLAGAQAGAVRVLSEHGDRLELVSELGLPPNVSCAERAVDRHCGVCGQAADGERVVWASDVTACAARCGDAYFGHGCRRVLAVALSYRARVLGVYNLFFDRDDEPGPEIRAVLKSVGDLLGLALHNARLERMHLRAALMDERQMMAAEVHDSIAQTLAFVKMRLPLLQEAMLEHDDARSLEYFFDVRRGLGHAHRNLREIISHFRTPLDPLGLLHALHGSAEEFRARSGVVLEFVNRVPDLALDATQEAQVFHIVQEALANTAKHALARHAWLSIGRRGHEIEIVAEDDGIGPVADGGAADAAGHHGVEIMGERARRLGGTLDVQPRAGGGTRVCLRFPAAGATAQANP